MSSRVLLDDRISDLFSSIVYSYSICNPIAITYFQLNISAMIFVIPEHRWQGKIELFLLERIARLNTCGQHYIRSKHVVEPNIKLIGKSSLVVIAHIKWVQNGIDAQIALILLADITFNSVDKIIPDDIPEDCFPGIPFLFRFVFAYGHSFFTGLLFILIQLFFLYGQRNWANKRYTVTAVSDYTVR